MHWELCFPLLMDFTTWVGNIGRKIFRDLGSTVELEKWCV